MYLFVYPQMFVIIVPCMCMKSDTVKSLFVAAATIEIDEFLAQNLLSKNYVLLWLLFKGGYYLRAATNNDFTVV